MSALDWVVAGTAAVSLYVLASWYLSPHPVPVVADTVDSEE